MNSHSAPQSAAPRPAASPFTQLVSALCDDEPNTGWSSGADLPALTRDDVQVVLAHRGDDVHEELFSQLTPEDLRDALASSNPIGTLGVRLNAAIERACRLAIYGDVVIEIEQRAEEAAREIPSRESEESRRGVATVFAGSHRA